MAWRPSLCLSSVSSGKPTGDTVDRAMSDSDGAARGCAAIPGGKSRWRPSLDVAWAQESPPARFCEMTERQGIHMETSTWRNRGKACSGLTLLEKPTPRLSETTTESPSERSNTSIIRESILRSRNAEVPPPGLAPLLLPPPGLEVAPDAVCSTLLRAPPGLVRLHNDPDSSKSTAIGSDGSETSLADDHARHATLTCNLDVDDPFKSTIAPGGMDGPDRGVGHTLNASAEPFEATELFVHEACWHPWGCEEIEQHNLAEDIFCNDAVWCAEQPSGAAAFPWHCPEQPHACCDMTPCAENLGMWSGDGFVAWQGVPDPSHMMHDHGSYETHLDEAHCLLPLPAHSSHGMQFSDEGLVEGSDPRLYSDEECAFWTSRFFVQDLPSSWVSTALPPRSRL